MLPSRAFVDSVLGQELTASDFGRCTQGAGTHRSRNQWGRRDETDRFLDTERDFPGARRLVEELVTLPVHRFASPRVAEELLAWLG